MDEEIKEGDECPNCGDGVLETTLDDDGEETLICPDCGWTPEEA